MEIKCNIIDSHNYNFREDLNKDFKIWDNLIRSQSNLQWTGMDAKKTCFTWPLASVNIELVENINNRTIKTFIVSSRLEIKTTCLLSCVHGYSM